MCDNMGQFASRDPIEKCALKDKTDEAACEHYKVEHDDGTVSPCMWLADTKKCKANFRERYGCPPPTPPPSAPPSPPSKPPPSPPPHPPPPSPPLAPKPICPWRDPEEVDSGECVDGGVEAAEGHECAEHVPFDGGGTFHTDAGVDGVGRPAGGKLPGMKCYYPTDDSVYFDCDATTPGKLRVCHCD